MSLVHNEQRKLTATALNTAATSSFTVGVLAPIAAAFYNLDASGHVSILTLVIGTTVWLSTAVALHLAARRLLKGLKP